ncbi:MAG: MoxR family ATPase [Spirochaetaceae bacterium]|nr:MAG: MoxR family ATPase [Spirochaetaceae bacterium]
MTDIKTWAATVTEAVSSVFFGKPEHIERFLIAILCRGHVLIEDVPGVGKTLLARAIARSLGGEFSHIQCTPDLLPSDVLGVSIYNQNTGQFTFRQGPVVTNVLLVDEINRATPRTQSALLEAMAEGQVSVEGRSIKLPSPFFLMATQSPTESEGTFPLPEVQKDRFFLSFNLGYPDRESESRIMLSQAGESRPIEEMQSVCDPETVVRMQEAILAVHVDERIKDYIMGIISRTRADARLTLGVSPRGSLALYRGAQALAALRGRDYVVPEDVKEIAGPILAKRVLIKTEHGSKGLTEAAVIDETLGALEVPGYQEGA